MDYTKYRSFYERTTKKLKTKPKLIKALSIADKALVLGFVAAYAAFLVYVFATLPFEWLLLLNKVGLPALCFAAVTLLRLLIKRPRPYETTGAGIDPLVKKSSSGNSMPSRHLASAVVIGLTVLPQSLLFGLLCLGAACALAALRFLEGVHYPTDLLAGGLLGAVFGVIGLLF
jgi:membrane-associated phospholipid phosphatase